ncbi:von Willebrand factor type A domain-containing protein [Rhodopirellula sp. JC740]|uniref:von Willebrand factor type A domain-containing protein n=1 Tax=Rhodopirellula halodulae TaxID=2894198 RepID=A0ABS8NCT7_9BACT|nr:von Willebrand factor type A domain-containing protein [Rhodopirellula sp. JC740]MCC9641214.1 von Willebrand factor type A domain-containing protein [Rhodopirellula sp. JC740]
MSNSSTSPPWDDPRVTAYVLGELSDQEAAQFTEEMNANTELATAVEEARAVTQQVESFFHSSAVPPLETNRVESIVRESETAATDEASVSAGSASGTSWFQSRWIQFAVAASIVGILLGLSIPAVHTARETASHQRPVSGQLPGDFSGMETDDLAVFEEEMPLADSEMVYQREAGVSAMQLSQQKEKADSLGLRSSARNSNLTSGPDANEFSASTSNVTMVEEAEGGQVEFVPTQGAAANAPTAEAEGMISEMDVMRIKVAGPTPRSMRKGMDGAFGAGGSLPPTPTAEAPAAPAEPSAGKPIMSKHVIGDFAVAPVPVQMGRGQVELESVRRRMARSELRSTNELAPAPAIVPAPTVPDIADGEGSGPGSSGDKFDPITENEFRRVTEHPLSTFSIDVDTASYAKVRSYLQRGQLPRPDSVRIEELINYFDYQYTPPTAEDSAPFSSAMAVASCPWNEDNRLVRVGIQAKDIDRKERPRCNLVFLIDTSGSMKRPNKLPLVIEGMKLLLDQLKKNDRVAIVVYAGSSGLVLDSTPVKQKKKIVRALSALSAGGSTNGGAGLQLAYQTARENFIEDGVNRVILCSDGDFNVGVTGTDQLVAEATRQSKSGTELTVLGFGMGNHNDAMMERISNSGAGNYAFVDTIAEANKVLADQVAGTLFTVAKDVKIQIEFNPAVVSAYRLIGYENRILAKEDFNDDTKDAGEIGAGHRVTALYEIAPSGKLPSSIAPDVDPLKYQPAENAGAAEEPATDKDAGEEGASEQETDDAATKEILTLKIRHKPPQSDVSEKLTFPLVNESQPFAEADRDFQFAAAVAGFGMQLRNSSHAGSWTMDDVISTAALAKGSDEHGLRAEFLELAETAKRLIIND